MVEGMRSFFTFGRKGTKKTGVDASFYEEKTDRGRCFAQLEHQLDILQNFGFKLVNKEVSQKNVFPEELRDGLLNYLKNKQNPIVLDAPCGLAKIGFDLVGQHSELQYIGIDLNPPENSDEQDRIELREQDLDTDFDIGVSAELALSLYGIRYFDDPIAFVNRLIANSSQDSFVIINGVKPISKTLENGETCNFFASQTSVPSEKVLIYYSDDWVILHVKDPSFSFEAQINAANSITRSNNPEHMWSDVVFKYK